VSPFGSALAVARLRIGACAQERRAESIEDGRESRKNASANDDSTGQAQGNLRDDARIGRMMSAFGRRARGWSITSPTPYK
jgi:hypothetical protein